MMYLHLKNRDVKIVKADTFFKKFLGLMGKKDIAFGMLFEKCNSVHTFFMREPIDIIGLDNNEVIYINRSVNKNKVVIVNNKIKNTSILELPNNASVDINIGDILSFESE